MKDMSLMPLWDYVILEKPESDKQTLRRNYEQSAFIVTVSILLCALIILLAFAGNAKAQDIDNKFIDAIAKVESNHTPSAFNARSGAIGIMQITPIVLKEYNLHNRYKYKPEELFDLRVNTIVGSWYLRRIVSHYFTVYKIPDTPDNICIAYNWGIGNLRKWLRNGSDYSKLPRETSDYISKVRKELSK